MEATTSLYSKYALRYVRSEIKTASGKRKSFDLGDDVAIALRGKTTDFLIKVCKENGVPCKHWESLNPGRFRMQVGRALRNIMKKQQYIIVEGRKIP